MKKIIALILVFAMTIGFMPEVAMESRAAEGDLFYDFTWKTGMPTDPTQITFSNTGGTWQYSGSLGATYTIDETTNGIRFASAPVEMSKKTLQLEINIPAPGIYTPSHNYLGAYNGYTTAVYLAPSAAPEAERASYFIGQYNSSDSANGYVATNVQFGNIEVKEAGNYKLLFSMQATTSRNWINIKDFTLTYVGAASVPSVNDCFYDFSWYSGISSDATAITYADTGDTWKFDALQVAAGQGLLFDDSGIYSTREWGTNAKSLTLDIKVGAAGIYQPKMEYFKALGGITNVYLAPMNESSPAQAKYLIGTYNSEGTEAWYPRCANKQQAIFNDLTILQSGEYKLHFSVSGGVRNWLILSNFALAYVDELPPPSKDLYYDFTWKTGMSTDPSQITFSDTGNTWKYSGSLGATYTFSELSNGIRFSSAPVEMSKKTLQLEINIPEPGIYTPSENYLKTYGSYYTAVYIAPAAAEAERATYYIGQYNAYDAGNSYAAVNVQFGNIEIKEAGTYKLLFSAKATTARSQINIKDFSLTYVGEASTGNAKDCFYDFSWYSGLSTDVKTIAYANTNNTWKYNTSVLNAGQGFLFDDGGIYSTREWGTNSKSLTLDIQISSAGLYKPIMEYFKAYGGGTNVYLAPATEANPEQSQYLIGNYNSEGTEAAFPNYANKTKAVFSNLNVFAAGEYKLHFKTVTGTRRWLILSNFKMEYLGNLAPVEKIVDFSATGTTYADHDATGTSKWRATSTPGYTVDRTKSKNLMERIYSFGGTNILTVDMRAYSNIYWPQYTELPDNRFTIHTDIPVAGNFKVSYQAGIWDAGCIVSIYVDGIYVGDYNAYDAAATGTAWHLGTVKELNSINLIAGSHEVSFRTRQDWYGNPYLTAYKLWFTPNVEEPVLSSVSQNAVPSTMNKTDTFTISAQAMMSNGKNQLFGYADDGTLASATNYISIESSNEAIVDVSNFACVAPGVGDTATATLTATGAGTATVTVTAIVNGVTKTASTDITVNRRNFQMGGALNGLAFTDHRSVDITVKNIDTNVTQTVSATYSNGAYSWGQTFAEADSGYLVTLTIPGYITYSQTVPFVSAINDLNVEVYGGDTNGDGMINIIDIAGLIYRYGQGAESQSAFDLDGDNAINSADIGITISNIGRRFA